MTKSSGNEKQRQLVIPVTGAAGGQELYDFLYDYASSHDQAQTLQVLPFARACHEGQFRAGKSRMIYFCHPLTVACQALSLDFGTEDILSTALLHDVCEDCGVTPEELPVNEETREAVRCLTRESSAVRFTPEGKRAYYDGVEGNARASIVKLLDRCNNISTMADAFPRKKIAAYIRDTQTYVYPLFERAAQYYPEHRGQIALIRYHMDSVISVLQHGLKRRSE